LNTPIVRMALSCTFNFGAFECLWFNLDEREYWMNN
jgi:hypothetical protein